MEKGNIIQQMEKTKGNLEFLEKKADESRKIIDEVARRKGDKAEKQKNEFLNSLKGKFFRGHTSCADDHPVEIYRVVEQTWPSYVNVEKWFYAHSGHYLVQLSGFSNAEDIRYLDEINEVEYYSEVTRFLKKISALQVITAEQDH